MVVHEARFKRTAKKKAVRLRKMGVKAVVFKKKKGFGVSSTR